MSEEMNDKELKDSVDQGAHLDACVAPKGDARKKISTSTFIFSAIALVLAAVMTTWAICGSFYKKKLNEARLELINDSASYEVSESLRLIEALFKNYAYYNDLDDEKIAEYILKSYIAATGDVHARYYTDEEYEAMLASTKGEGEGIGITVIKSEISYNGELLEVVEIVSVASDAPAKEVGVKVGDLIAWVYADGEKSVDSIGYNAALSALKGQIGTYAQFSVLRPLENGEYEKISFSAERRKVVYSSVKSAISESDPSIGILAIYSFDTVTPLQLCEEMDALIAHGCDKFVFDLRYNLGGDLKSIKATLSYFLEAGDVILSAVDTNKNERVIKAEPVLYDSDRYASCSVTDLDIGKYRGYKFSVICNSQTASAAELFVAAMRDHDLADIVGDKTYGKGSIQQTIELDQFGYSGALKITTELYFPPCGEGYDGEGITPDILVSLSDEAKKYNRYKLPQSLDDQLIAAIDALK